MRLAPLRELRLLCHKLDYGASRYHGFLQCARKVELGIVDVQGRDYLYAPPNVLVARLVPSDEAAAVDE